MMIRRREDSEILWPWQLVRVTPSGTSGSRADLTRSGIAIAALESVHFAESKAME